MILTGMHFNYYLICKRKLWLYSNYIREEDNSMDVLEGRLYHEDIYKREANRKEVLFEFGKIDFVDKNGYLHEFKKSKAGKDGAILQMLHYLATTGLKKGFLHYQNSKKVEVIEFTKEKQKAYLKIKSEIQKIIRGELLPEIESNKFCKKCSYREFCYA